MAERYGAAAGGADPVAWWDGLDAGRQNLLLAQERVRVGEEEAQAASLAAAAAGGRATRW